MSLLTHTVTHDVDLSTARRATRCAFEEYQRRLAAFSPTVAWTDDDHAHVGFHVKGVPLRGAVALRDHTIDLAIDIPFLLRPFQKRAMSAVDEGIRVWLAKARAGEI